jgi:hypothetical protein
MIKYNTLLQQSINYHEIMGNHYLRIVGFSSSPSYPEKVWTIFNHLTNMTVNAAKA